MARAGNPGAAVRAERNRACESVCIQNRLEPPIPNLSLTPAALPAALTPSAAVTLVPAQHSSRQCGILFFS